MNSKFRFTSNILEIFPLYLHLGRTSGNTQVALGVKNTNAVTSRSVISIHLGKIDSLDNFIKKHEQLLTLQLVHGCLPLASIHQSIICKLNMEMNH